MLNVVWTEKREPVPEKDITLNKTRLVTVGPGHTDVRPVEVQYSFSCVVAHISTVLCKSIKNLDELKWEFFNYKIL